MRRSHASLLLLALLSLSALAQARPSRERGARSCCPPAAALRPGAAATLVPALTLPCQAAQAAPRRAALAEVAQPQPGVAEAEQAALAVLEAGDKGKPKRPKKEKRPEPLPEEVLR